MKFISIFNDVLGPVMRGPSSSHTAGSYRIGVIARSLLDETPESVMFTFDPGGSYIKTYRQQGVDLALAAGLMEWPITDERFPHALDTARKEGIKIEFNSAPLAEAHHPNTVQIDMRGSSGKKLSAVAQSTGGGAVQYVQIDGWPVDLDGKSWYLLVECNKNAVPEVADIVSTGERVIEEYSGQEAGNNVLVAVRSADPLDSRTYSRIKALSEVKNIRSVPPVFFIMRGKALFESAEEMIAAAEARHCSLGRVALEYESALLGLTEEEALNEMIMRLDVMRKSVADGLRNENVRMQLLEPTAGRLLKAESSGKVAIGGIHTRAAARAMAAMHVSNSMGTVCAAPTAGSAGVIPGVIVSLVEDNKINPENAAVALFAASAVGLIVAQRATFAAEVAGCQVEIGAAGAMAAAAVVEYAGGTARQAADAAAISFQNSMGSICDLVQGMCEIPCHTRNAAAASGAFVCADIVLGGYYNPIPLDETIDSMYAVGKMLPAELRCTALGGIAVTPSALAMRQLR
ncbi:L-serine ammonia-lyase, iron-sulfur-dependent, subunit alpha [candidate division KSB1 bacterium]